MVICRFLAQELFDNVDTFDNVKITFTVVFLH